MFRRKLRVHRRVYFDGGGDEIFRNNGAVLPTVLPEKLKCPKLLKKFPAFYETRRFITAIKTARHPSLS
jgi:hypothetical protein